MHLHRGSVMFTQRQWCIYTEIMMHLHRGNDAFTLRQGCVCTEAMMHLLWDNDAFTPRQWCIYTSAVMCLNRGNDSFTLRQLCIYTEAMMLLHRGNDEFTQRLSCTYTGAMMHLQVLKEQIFSFITCHKNLAITTWCRCFYRTATSFHPKSTSTNRRTWANVLVSCFFRCLVIFELTNPGFAVVSLLIQFGMCCKLRQELSWSFPCLHALNTFWVNKCMYMIIILIDIELLTYDMWCIGNLSIGERNCVTKGNTNPKMAKQRDICSSYKSVKFKKMNNAYSWVVLI